MINAKFQADFSSFSTAVDKAEVQLKSFETEAGKVETSLNRMSNSLSGQRMVQDATLMAAAVEKVGGTSALTAKELERVSAQAKEATEKMRALGIGVPENLQKIADAAKPAQSGFDKIIGSAKGLAAAFGVGFGIQQIISFGKAILDDADSLVKMSDRTGITISGLQRLQSVGDDAGNTIEEMTSAVNKLQDKLDGGDKSATGALRRLNIDLTQFKNLSPENQFIAISDAIRTIHDPAQQTALAIDLFGKAGASVLPTLKAGFDSVKGAAVGMSEDTVRALDETGDELAKMWRGTKALAGEAVVGLLHWADAGFNPVIAGARDARRQIQGLTDEIARMTASIKAAPKLPSIGELPAIDPDGAHAREQAREVAELERKLAERKRETAAATAEAKKAEDQWNKSVKDATVSMNLSIYALNTYGAVALPNVHSGIEGLDQAIDHLDSETLVDLKVRLQDVGMAGVAAFQAPQESAKGFGSFLQNELGGLITGAFMGGGDVGKTIGAGLGDEIGKGIISEAGLGGFLTKNLGKTLGGALSSLVPGLGAIAGSLLGKGIEALFSIGAPSKAELDARNEVGKFEERMSSALTAQQRAEAGGRKWAETLISVRDNYAKIGLSSGQAEADVARLWASSKEGAGASAAAVKEIEENLAKVKEQEEAASDAAQASADMRSKHAAEAQAQLDALSSQRKSLFDSIANEAPEEVMGVVEAATRAQISVLDQQIEEQRKDLAAQAEAAAQALEDELGGIHPQPVPVPWYWDRQGPDLPSGGFVGEGPDIIPMASGGIGRVTKPTLFLAGERGSEDVAFSGGGKRFGGGSDGGDVHIHMEGAFIGAGAKREIESIVSRAVSTRRRQRAA